MTNIVYKNTYKVVVKMVYLKRFILPSDRAETEFIMSENRTIYNTFYPFKVFPDKDLRVVDFENITIFYGGNGSGKSTLINVISEKLGAMRYSEFNSSPFFDRFVEHCYTEIHRRAQRCVVLSSDDVFDYVLNARTVNDGLDERRNALIDEYMEIYNATMENPELGLLKGLDDYERWAKNREILSKRRTQSSYVKKRVACDVDLYSNGETAMRYFLDRINDDGIYLLDEPENSLSAELQIELADYLLATVRATRSQFIIATHSPILLAIPGAKIYNLDARPATPCRWTELPNVRRYFDFFMEHLSDFDD
jgi:predicted ATPase